MLGEVSLTVADFLKIFVMADPSVEKHLSISLARKGSLLLNHKWFFLTHYFVPPIFFDFLAGLDSELCHLPYIAHVGEGTFVDSLISNNTKELIRWF